MAFTLKQLRYFVAVAEQGGITPAARQVNIAQPSISAAISQLEADFQVQLFLRHRAQGMSLTSAGRRLLAEARGLLGYAEELGEHARGLGQALRGRLELGCFLTFTPLHLPYLVTSFAAQHPQAEIRLSEGPQETLLRGLEDGRFDLALLYDFGLPTDLTLEPLAVLPPYAVLPENHPLASRKRVRLRDLAKEPLVLLDVAPSRDYFTALFHRAGLEPTIGFLSPSFETVRSMVGNGVGYSILVTRPASDLTYDGRKLVCLPLVDEVEPGRVVLARSHQARPTRLSQTFEAHCKAYFAENAASPQ